MEDKAEEVKGLEQSVADLEALLDKESLAEYERLKENRACDRPKVRWPFGASLACVAGGTPWWSWGWS